MKQKIYAQKGDRFLTGFPDRYAFREQFLGKLNYIKLC